MSQIISNCIRLFSTKRNIVPLMQKATLTCAGAANKMEFKSIAYSVQNKVAHVQLNRPNRMNAIDYYMPKELSTAVEMANMDDDVKVCTNF